MTLAEYKKTCFEVSRLVISRYSTSFWLGALVFPARIRSAIAAIYGFTRLADEIVDTFHDYDQCAILNDLRHELQTAMDRGISTNPVIHAFMEVSKEYGIDGRYINAFLHSMEMDLTLKRYNRQQYDEYVYGSAEVIGLMCLSIFCHGQLERWSELVAPGRKLGAAFQKVNFLRDLKTDLEDRGRIYLPGINRREEITNSVKKQIEAEITADFDEALAGIRRLPVSAKVGVYSTFLYYRALFDKLRRKDVQSLLSRRVRVPNLVKIGLLIRAWLAVKLNRI